MRTVTLRKESHVAPLSGAPAALPSPHFQDLRAAFEFGAQVRAAFEQLTPGLEAALAAAAPIFAAASAAAQRSTLEERVFFLEGQVRRLRIDLSTLRSSQSKITLLSTFAPEPYELLRPIPISIATSDDAYTAGFYDANIHAAGDTEEEAFRNLKSLTLDVFDSLMAEPLEQLGPEPKRQRTVLQSFIRRAGA